MFLRARQLLKRRGAATKATVLLAGCALLLGAFRYAHHTPGVSTIEIKSGEFLDSVQFQGEVTALKSISITAPAEAGDLQILKIAADGTKVEQGDSIVEFDRTSTQQDLAQHQSSLKYTAADIEQSRATARLTEEKDLTAVMKAHYDLESAKLDASKQEIVSKIEGAEAELKVNDAEKSLREAEQKLESDRAASRATIDDKIDASQKAAFDLKRAQTALSKMTLRAPVAGVVSLVSVPRMEGESPFKAGDRAWPGAPIAELPDSSSLRIDARVDETERGRLVAGQLTNAHFDAIPDRQFAGKIEEISTIATEDYSAGWPIPRNFTVRVVLDSVDSRLRPGMTAHINVTVDRVPDAITIPVQASFQKDGESLAYVWTGSKFNKRVIEIGRRSGDRILVAKGLEVGDRIALEDPTAKE
ncbi:MAG TPA: efflux RND transporter periplasmic adaptor subunit [Terriglobales bacterium]|jgi:RND family efflux transporter MFP subunit